MARPQSPDFSDKKRALLHSAATVFATQGMDKASMAQIARHSGVSKALLYHYYPGKDALIFDIIHSHLSDLDTALAHATDPGLPPDQQLHVLVGAVLDAYRDGDNAHKVQLNAAAHLNDAQRAHLTALERQIVRRFSTVLARINPNLAKDPAVLTPVTMSLFGMMNWVYMWFRDDGSISRADYARLATNLVLHGIGGINTPISAGHSALGPTQTE